MHFVACPQGEKATGKQMFVCIWGKRVFLQNGKKGNCLRWKPPSAAAPSVNLPEFPMYFFSICVSLKQTLPNPRWLKQGRTLLVFTEEDHVNFIRWKEQTSKLLWLINREALSEVPVVLKSSGLFRLTKLPAQRGRNPVLFLAPPFSPFSSPSAPLFCNKASGAWSRLANK